MSKNLEVVEKEPTNEITKTCFVIMPISESQNYDAGHFKRVYEYIIKPACITAGFDPIRADEVKATNIIVIDIIQKIVTSDMVVCDLSSKNPNVLYELGIRQSFDLPVTLLKDDVTDRIFDIQGFRDVQYNSNLRIDEVRVAIDSLSKSITETYNRKGKEVNSIVEMLGISKAALKEPINITPDTNVILQSINNLNRRIIEIEEAVRSVRINQPNVPNSLKNSHGTIIEIGDEVFNNKFGEGLVIDIIMHKDGPMAKVRFGDVTHILPPAVSKSLEVVLPF